MTKKSHLKKRIIKTSILVSIMFTHTGCVFGYFENPMAPVEKPKQNTIVSNSPQQHNVVRNTPKPTTVVQHTSKPTTVVQHTPKPTTVVQHTPRPTTVVQHTSKPTTVVQHTPKPTTVVQHTSKPTTVVQHTPKPTTVVQHTSKPTTVVQHTPKPTTATVVQHTPKPILIAQNIPKQNRTFNSTHSAPVNVVFNNPAPIVAECTDDDSSHCTKAPIKANEIKAKVETAAGGEVHKLQSIKGENITVIERPTGFIFPEHKNKIVILEMFGKKCSHCIKEIPSLNQLRRKYKGKVKIVAVQVEDKMSLAEANRFIRKYNIHYPIVPGETATNLQFNIQNTYGWTGILPFTMIIKNGVTEFTYPGTVSYNEMNKAIRSIIK